MEKFNTNFFNDFFDYLEVSPRLTGGKLLLKGWCHGSEQHCVWVNIEDMTVECSVCGKMTIAEYVDAVYPNFAAEDESIQDTFLNKWEADNDIEVIVVEMMEAGIEDSEYLRDQIKACTEYLYYQGQLEMINYNATKREIKEDNKFFFRGLPIELKQGTKQVSIKEECAWEAENETKNVNRYLWCWDGGEYERSDFFKAGFPEYNKYKKKVVASEEAAENLMRLSTTQRQKLFYDVLAAYYPIVEVDAADANDLLDFCKSQKNQTANDTVMRLNWEDGLAKMVSFGLGVSMQGAASMTWCYEVEYLPTKRKYRSVDMTWERWRIGIIEKLSQTMVDGLEYDEAWNSVRPIIYCQNKIRLTLCEADRMRLFGFINAYLKNGCADWPETLKGKIGDDYEFVVDFYADFEIKEKAFMRQEGGMAAFHKERGCIQVMSRFIAAFPNVECGEILTTKQLKEAGYSDKKAIARLVKHEIIENFAYGKYRVLWRS